MLSFPTKEEDFFFRDWKLLSSDYVIFGNITSLENTININYFVSDVNLERIVLNGDVNGSKEEIELIIKIMSDRVYESITGLKGIFNTKLSWPRGIQYLRI